MCLLKVSKLVEIGGCTQLFGWIVLRSFGHWVTESRIRILPLPTRLLVWQRSMLKKVLLTPFLLSLI